MNYLVRARTLQGFGELVQALGADPRLVLERAGLSAQALDCEDEWISFKSVLVAYEAAALVTRCASFGLQLSGQRDLAYLGPIGLIFKYSKNLQSGVYSAIKYMTVHNTGYYPSLDISEDAASWRMTIRGSLRPHANQWMEESMLTAMKFLRMFLGEEYTPRAVALQHAASPNVDYGEYFGASMQFSAPFDGLILEPEVLNAPNPIGDTDLYQFFVGYFDSRVLRAEGDIPNAVESLLKSLIPTGKFSVDIVADQLGLHRRKLQRQLSEAGLSYAEILDESRKKLAGEYLATSNLPMVNLAYMLGYGDQSAFNHAFRRWYGVTPKKWRAMERN